MGLNRVAPVVVLSLILGSACRSAAVSQPPATPAAVAPAAAASPAPAPRTVQPGAPGQPSRTMSAAAAAAPKYTPADVAFMQGMIGHHAQALEMVALLKTRTQRQDMRMMGLRIEVSQTDEIKLMQAWLRARGEAAPDEHAHHAHDAKLMPGMLTPEQMARLAAATGSEFDKLFLELMIQHHDGALIMVKDLMASPGAGQDADLFQFAADVEADQSAEISRMRAMRGAMGR
jgi:uncharacterized protein (DUF305 family)